VWFTDFTNIKSGALLRADGGYLVLNAADALNEPGVWKTLKRVLLYRKLEIQSVEGGGQVVNSALKPEAIDINVKVILIGNNEIYATLSSYERDFKKIFKVKADFDYEIENTPDAIQQYASLLHKLIVKENLKHFDKSAVCNIIEYGARLTDSQKKLTTQFSEIADVVREAHYWCNRNNHPYVTKADVDTAIEKLIERHSLYEEKLQDLYDDGVILLDIEGRRVGQINGLAVYGGERFSFGKPSRITAAVSAGNSGIINIEREAKLSGKTHDKGVLILSGYLREQFASKKPLALIGSVSFEQSYNGVDGDSASSAEMYALISAITNIPIKQQYAVTGSMNQKGDIQPIGGVNEKIEGFFGVCKAQGLNGNQGVIIPKQNLDDLMLREEVIEAVREKKFHIYPIERIEDGLEILTGVKAGKLTPRGNYEKNTIYWNVARKLAELSAAGSRQGQPAKRKKAKDKK
jgi:lon-related putative ATP-dependent protease